MGPESFGHGGSNQNKPIGFGNQFGGQSQPRPGWNQQQTRPPQNNGSNGQMQPTTGKVFALQGTEDGYDRTIDRGTFPLLDLLLKPIVNESHPFVVANSHNIL